MSVIKKTDCEQIENNFEKLKIEIFNSRNHAQFEVIQLTSYLKITQINKH